MKRKSYTQFNILLAFALSLLVGCSPKDSDDEKNNSDGQAPHTEANQNELKSQSQPIFITGAFIKELPPGKTTAAMYLLMTNNSSKTQTLSYVHSPIAETIEAHRVMHEEGMMKMRQVKHLRINPGQKLAFEPGGYHLMVFGISEPLKVGSTFPVTLEFEGGINLTVDVLVKPHG